MYPVLSHIFREGAKAMMGDIRAQVIMSDFVGSLLKIEQKGLKFGLMLLILLFKICIEKELWMKE